MTVLPCGVFQPGNSVIHELHATAKLLCLLLTVSAVIAMDSLAGYVIAIVVIFAIVYITEMKLNAALWPLARLTWFLAVILLLNLFFYAPEAPWLSFWIFRPSMAGLMQGVAVIIRIVLVIVINNVLIATTSPNELTNAIDMLLSPLHYMKIPTAQAAVIISVALQFVPTLINEAELIRKAQIARGAGFESRKLYERAAAFVPLIVPVFISAFRRADELALAMEARGYRTDNGVKQKRWVKPDFYDYAAILVCMGLLGLEIVVLQAGA